MPKTASDNIQSLIFEKYFLELQLHILIPNILFKQLLSVKKTRREMNIIDYNYSSHLNC